MESDTRAVGEASIEYAIDQFTEQCQALMDLLNELVPHAGRLDEPETTLLAFSEAAKQIPKPDRPAVVKIFRERALELPGGRIDVTPALRELIDRYGDVPWGAGLVLELHNSIQRQPRLPMLMNALITTAVGAFEVLIANVATSYYRAVPEALEALPRDQQKEFTLRDLKDLGSVDDAVELAIARRVENLMFGSLLDWHRFFGDRLKVSLDEMAIDWPHVQEVIERRHLIVHTGAHASRRYVRRLAQLGSDDIPEVGAAIISDNKYVRDAVDHLLTTGVLFATSVLLKLGGHASLTNPRLLEMAYNQLLEGRHAVVAKVCTFGESHAADQEDALIFRVNGWLARRASGETEHVRAEVEEWDCSALGNKFKLARAALLDDLDQVFDLLAEMVRGGELPTASLVEWPLLADARADARFDQVLAAAPTLELEDMPSSIMAAPRGRTYHSPGCRRLPASAVKVDADWVATVGATACQNCSPLIPA